MKLRTWMAASAVVSCSLLATGAAFATAAPFAATIPHSHQPHHLTWSDVRRMSVAQIARLQNPLIAEGTPVANLQYTSRWSGLFAAVALDTPNHLIDLYVTDPARAGALLAAAKKADPRLNVSLFRVFRARYSISQIHDAQSRILTASIKGQLPFHVYSVNSPGNDPSALEVMVAHPQADQRLAARLARLGGRSLTSVAGVRLRFVHGSPIVPMTGRGNDTAPFIGGDNIEETSGGFTDYCSTGIALEFRGHDYILTAAHCYADGSTVHNGNGSATVGNVLAASLGQDAEIIDTGLANGNGSLAAEGEKSLNPTGILNYVLADTVGLIANEVVFQDGYSTWVKNSGVAKDWYAGGSTSYPETNSWGTYTVFAATATSYAGGTCDASSTPGCAVITGDSGAVVFTFKDSAERNALGLVSAGSGGSNCAPGFRRGCTTLLFTTINPILTNTGYILNPNK